MLRKLISILVFCFAVSAHGHAQQIGTWQINWSNSTGCSTVGQPYVPQTDTCLPVLQLSPSGAQTITQPSTSQPLSVNYVSLAIVNNIPMVDAFCGLGTIGGVTTPACSADLCVKLRSAELYAIANHIGTVDATHFPGPTQSCSVDPFIALATAGTTTPLTILLPATTIQFSFVNGLGNGLTVNTSGINLFGQGRFSTIFQFIGTSALNCVFCTGALNNPNGSFQIFRDFSVIGNSHVINGFSLQNWHRSTLEGVSAWGVTGSGIFTDGAVSDTFINPHVSFFDAALANPVWTSLPAPTCGICMSNSGGNQTTAGTVLDGAFEGINGPGIELLSANSMFFSGGTSEENVRGVKVDAGSKWDSFQGLDIEQNTLGTAGVDIADLGQSTIYANVIAASACSSCVSATFGGSGGQLIFSESGFATLWSGSVNVLGVTSFFAGNAAATTTVSNLQSNGNASTLGLQVTHNLGNGIGIQTVSAAGCTYAAGTIGTLCNNTITLPVTEPDTAYNTTCGIRASAGGANVTANISNTSVSQITVATVALQTTSTGGGFIDCTITHR
jgi:hypothetical protein